MYAWTHQYTKNVQSSAPPHAARLTRLTEGRNPGVGVRVAEGVLPLWGRRLDFPIPAGDHSLLSRAPLNGLLCAQSKA